MHENRRIKFPYRRTSHAHLQAASTADSSFAKSLHLDLPELETTSARAGTLVLFFQLPRVHSRESSCISLLWQAGRQPRTPTLPVARNGLSIAVCFGRAHAHSLLKAQ